jgi:hypothetical protein
LNVISNGELIEVKKAFKNARAHQNRYKYWWSLVSTSQDAPTL